MKEIIMTIPDETVENLLGNIPRNIKITDYVLDSLCFYIWVVEQLSMGRIIASSTADLTDIRKITTDTLDLIKRSG